MARTKQLASKKPSTRSTGGEAKSPSRTKSPRKSSRGGSSSRTEPSTPGSGTQRKRYKFKQGTVALREIRKYQKTCTLLIPAAPFIRVIREITQFYSNEVCRWTPEALIAIQEALRIIWSICLKML